LIVGQLVCLIGDVIATTSRSQLLKQAFSGTHGYWEQLRVFEISVFMFSQVGIG
jgi:hypothetical protein